jgi:signal transduction histidine kinase
MQKRIIISIILGILIILSSLGIISYVSVHDSIERSLQNRLVLAEIIGKYIDHMLESNLTRLHDISNSGRIDFEDDDWTSEKRAIKTAYEYSIFTDRIFLLDLYGNVVLTYPHQEGSNINLLNIPYVSETIAKRRPFISDVYTMEPSQRKVILALVPLRNKNGDIIGVAGGEINPTNYIFTQVLKSIPVEESTAIELVDSHGIIISSNQPQRILTCSDHNKFLGNLILKKQSSVGVCHRCHLEEDKRQERTQDMLAFAPLSLPSWGITVREPQEVVFAPSRLLQKGFVSLSLIAIGTSVMLGMGLSRSIVKPIRVLSQAARRIGKGNLSEPVSLTGKDEISSLADSFDTMRRKLSESYESIHKQNMELEQRVAMRTRDLAKSRAQLSKLVVRLMNTEEKERKRIARELHDDTSQSLNAILMSLDALSLSLGGDNEVREKLKRLRRHCVMSLQGLHTIIKDLRPPVLDDLGLVSAIKWVMETHLGENGITYTLKGHNGYRDHHTRTNRLIGCEQLELQIFRVIQESVVNIAKHSHATEVSADLDVGKDYVIIEIDDNGRGFEVEKVQDRISHDENLCCMGLLGMRERVGLLNGEITICSRPNEGTYVSVYIPV